MPEGGAAPTLAQTSQKVCPLTTRLAQDPSVTAQDVDNGTRSLMEFLLAVRESALESSRISFGCVTTRGRSEVSPWYSGSTYIVRLNPSGSVSLHGKDMGLSARRLKPTIYQDILAGLGIGQDDMANPSAALVAATRRNGGSFTVPGTSSRAYATVYIQPGLKTPFVLTAGFDLNESHLVSLADEKIEYGNPSVTARDVVDRDTLKTFVTEAGNHIQRLLKSRDPEAIDQIRLGLRDPNGPWRQGSVYLYVWDLTNRTILLHAGFPNTYELQPLRPVARDAVTGAYILPQLITAANSGPEGGFVEYHFDNPSDALDSVDIPKTGYVRKFVVQIPRLDGGSARAFSFVVGAGFYPSPSQVSQSTVVEEVLPQIM